VAVRAVRRAGVGDGGGTKRGDAMSTTTTNVKERPVIFSAPMIRAILEGRKTQTRRIIKPQPPAMFCEGDVAAITNGKRWAFSRMYAVAHGVAFPADPEPGYLCPYGQPGDRLWVRESWQITGRLGTEYSVWYPAGGEAVGIDVGFEGPDPKWDAMIHEDRVRNPLFMPRWASRITLEVTDVRVERVRDIGRDGRKAHDVLAEGITPDQIAHQAKFFHSDDAPALTYAILWDSINGKGSWRDNPWVWVVEFKRVEVPR
jgi:hypothetical protein